MQSCAPSFPASLLAQVSRSFYLTLRVLPRRVRPQISLAYLLARASDTIADTELVPASRRRAALGRLRERLQGGSGDLGLGDLTLAQGNPAERTLLQRLEEPLASLAALSAADRSLVRQVLDTITLGQDLDLARFGEATVDRITALADEAELEDYTYRVAGCVGEFWTRLCLAHGLGVPARVQCAQGPARAGAARDFEQPGRRFGQGLQLVNILRDLPRDLRQGRCYLPLNRLRALGLQPADLLDPACEAPLRPLYNALLDQAVAHLADGWNYTGQIPVLAPRLRLACAWPVLLGVRTLALLRTRNPLDPDDRVKVPRPAVRALLVRSLLFYPAPPLWRLLWREAGGQDMP
ncbi:MAG: hypothetical protein RJA22_839 [Verrucomicrobiota bacterium]